MLNDFVCTCKSRKEKILPTSVASSENVAQKNNVGIAAADRCFSCTIALMLDKSICIPVTN